MPEPRIRIPKDRLENFCHRYQVRRMALFGSVLRDDFRTDSDVDILVSFHPSARISMMTLGRMQRELADLFQRPVDLVPQEGLKPAIRDAVLSSSQVVYAS